MHAIALEVLDPAIVETDRDIDDQGPLGPPQGLDPGLQAFVEERRDAVDLFEIDVPGPDIFTGNVRRQYSVAKHVAPPCLLIALPGQTGSRLLGSLQVPGRGI